MNPTPPPHLSPAAANIVAWFQIAHEVAPYAVALVFFVIGLIKTASAKTHANEAKSEAKDAGKTATAAATDAALAKQQAEINNARLDRHGDTLKTVLRDMPATGQPLQTEIVNKPTDPVPTTEAAPPQSEQGVTGA